MNNNKVAEILSKRKSLFFRLCLAALAVLVVVVFSLVIAAITI